MLVKAWYASCDCAVAQVGSYGVYISDRIGQACSNGRLIDIDVTQPMRAFCASVANFEHSVGHDLVLYRKVVIQIAGHLEGRSPGCDQLGWAEPGTCCRPEVWIVEQIKVVVSGVLFTVSA